MTNDQAHRGARAPLHSASEATRRITAELDAALRASEADPSTASPLLMRDSVRTASLHLQALNRPGRILFGMVVQAVPYANWYRVQFGGGGGTCGACALSTGSFTPFGPRDLGGPRAQDMVLCFKPQGLPYAFILGTAPPTLLDPKLSCPDWVVQGSGSGLLREQAHNFVLKNFKRGGGVADYSANRPLDSTTLDRGFVTSLGGVFSLDDYLFQFRLNEMCGLWLSYFDSWCRLAGQQLLIESASHEVSAGEDEGESCYFFGSAAYPWEALGLSKSSQTLTEENDAKAVQYEKNVASLDLPEERRDLQPLYRYREFGGYLGQGRVREVIAPSTIADYHRFGSSANYIGLFRESIGLDGSYTVLSAKSFHIGKRIKIPVGKVIKPAEAKAGDDRASDNYRFSGQFGSGDEHKVVDLQVTGDDLSMRRVAAFSEIIAYDLNWKALHPFHYHKADYSLPQDSDSRDVFSRVQEKIDYTVLARKSYINDPTARKLRIDHRYGDVSFYEREAFIRIYDDGSIHIACGAGSEVVLAGGTVGIVAPGGIRLVSGTDVVLLGDQIVARANGAMDFSSSNSDVRIKAERNLHVLAGNSGEGGLLLESRGTGATQQFRNLFGEDVQSSGIILKAANSTCAVLGQDLYFRTGGDTLGRGEIVFDAAQGQQAISFFGSTVQMYAAQSVAFAIGPHEETSQVNQTYYFSSGAALFDAGIQFSGSLVGYGGGDIVLDGGIRCTRAILTAGSLSSAQGGPASKAPEGLRQAIQQQTAPIQQVATLRKAAQTQQHQASIVQSYYQTGQLGNEALLADLSFSFRDPPATPGRQYHTESLRWYEGRWQYLSRIGLATGGTAWTEPPVVAQGAETLPWPGKAKWQEDSVFVQLSQPVLFSADTGCAVDRPGPYETAKIGEFQNTTMAKAFTLLRD